MKKRCTVSLTKLSLAMFGVSFANLSFAADTQMLSAKDTIHTVNKSIQAGQPLLKSLGSDIELKAILSSQKRTQTLNHQRYQQTYRGIPVWGRQVVLHTKADGTLSKLNGTVSRNISADLSAIKATIPASKGSDVLAQFISQVSQELNQEPIPWQVSQQQAKLIIYIDDNDTAVLAWHVEFFYQTEAGQVGKPIFIVDASPFNVKKNTVLKRWDNLQYAQATGPGGNAKIGQYEYGVDKPALEVTRIGDTCTLENEKVKTHDAQHVYALDQGEVFSFECSRNTYKAINGAYSPLNDAHAFGTNVFDMFNDWYGVSPLGTQLQLYVHHGHNYGNAFFNGVSFTFGDGADVHYPYTVLDTVGHEIAHGFTYKNSGLIYGGESGGINEAFSDITGEVAEYYVTGTTDWLHGSDLRKGDRATRYMATPEQNNRAIGHAKDYFDGVEKHSSSGIFNRAFYLLATTPGWDPHKAYDLFVAANQHYWIESSTFVQGACGVINAALDVESGISVFDVDQAFIQVGVVCNNYPVTDSDGDGLPDFWESRYALDPANAQDGKLDSDNDGLTNVEEYQLGTIPNNVDSDGDNLSDSDELNTHETNPLLADTDADKLPDNWEVAHGFDPLVVNDVATDSDNDSYSDWIEFKAGTNPKDINDSPVQIAQHFESFEGSELPAGWHIPADNNLGWQIDNEAALRGKQSLKALGQNSNQASIIEWSGYFVAGELSFDVTQTLEHPEPVAIYIDDVLYAYVNSTPAQWRGVHINLDKGFHTIGFRTYKSSASQQIRIDNIRYFQTAADADNDGMYDRWEFDHGLNFNDPSDAALDGDNDGLSNLEEYQAQTNPNNPDSDGDGLIDGDEINVYGTNPTSNDSDNDGLSDADELNVYQTNPMQADSDGDLMPDGWEVANGFSPTEHNPYIDTDGDGVIDYDEYLAGTSPHDASAAPALIYTTTINFDSNSLPDFLTSPEDSDGNWQLSNEHSKSPDYSLKSGFPAVDKQSVVQWTGYFSAGEVSFDYKISTHVDSAFSFTIDGHESLGTSGEQDWTLHKQALSQGMHTLRWTYIKRHVQDGTSAAVWLDNVMFISQSGDGSQDNTLIADIEFVDATMANCVSTTASDNGWTTVDQMTELACKSQNIVDVSGIENLTALTKLDLRQNHIKDITPLAGLTALTQLKLTKNQLSNITALAQLKALTFLSLSNNQIDDTVLGGLDALVDLSNLTKLYLRGSRIVDVSALSGLTGLSHLYLRDNQIVDITGLSGLSNLAVLQLNNNLLSDITALFKLANTRRIDLAGNNGIACADLSALEATLGQAVVTRPAQCDGISPLISSINFADDVLATCVQAVAKTNGWTTADQITQLTCKAMNISDLKGIENLPWLTSLDLRQNQITDIAPLVNLTAVTQLKLTKNRLDDVTSLANLADLSFLSISNNQFGDAVFGELSSLTNLTKLYLRGSQVVDISTLADLQSLTHLYLRDNQIVDIAALSDLPSLAVLQLSNNLISDVSGLLIIDGIRRIDLASNNTIACADLDELDTALGESVVTRPAGCDGISPLISAIKFSDVALEACVQAAAAMNSWTSADEMTQLDCSAQGISDLRGIENLTALTTLDLSNNQISDIAPLVNLSGLTELELSDNLL